MLGGKKEMDRLTGFSSSLQVGMRRDEDASTKIMMCLAKVIGKSVGGGGKRY